MSVAFIYYIIDIDTGGYVAKGLDQIYLVTHIRTQTMTRFLV